MNALWKVGEFRSSHTPSETVLCLVMPEKADATEKHHSFVRWVYTHDGGAAFDTWYDAKCPAPKDDAPYHWRINHKIGKDKSREVWMAARAEADAFKAYVHQRLDAMGVPHSLPESEHGVGGRLDWVEAHLKRYLWLRSCTVGPSMIERTLYQTVNDDCNPPYRDLMHGADLDRAIDGQLKP